VVYFTKATFPAVLERLGLRVREILTYPSALEDLLVGVTQVAERGCETAVQDVDVTRNGLRGVSTHDAARRPRCLGPGVGRRARGRPSRVLAGAGHLAIMFLNLLELQDTIEFVVDDDPAKCGWFLPGSRLPIYPSDTLYTRLSGCAWCRSPLRTKAECRHRHRRFLESGGRLPRFFQAAISPCCRPHGSSPRQRSSHRGNPCILGHSAERAWKSACWATARWPVAPGRPPEVESIQILEAALDRGVSFFDTADTYCLGPDDLHHNERLLARAIPAADGAVRPMLIATKGGTRRTRKGWEVDGSPEHLYRSICASYLELGATPRFHCGSSTGPIHVTPSWP